ncbi:MAG TPA: hypothetical protein PL070_08635 [Flavobacteriales bacterium]|nr:hypothetical protein [Flavobacteriales bacterium]
MPVLTHKERRNKDIYEFVTGMVAKEFNGKAMYRYQYVLEKASMKFYLEPDHIANIVRSYVPPAPDPDQMDLFEDTKPQPSTK